jgi:aspartate racemase
MTPEGSFIRRLGLIGGCGAESTALYYAGLNRAVRARRPGHGAPLLLWSFDVEAIDALIREDDWEAAFARFAEAADWLAEGGAEALVICTNSMHRIADRLAARAPIPLIHIVDVVAAALLAGGRRRPLLLGTRYVMGQPFYPDRLRAAGLDPLTPEAAQQDGIHDLIYEELMSGRVSGAARAQLVEAVEAAAGRGADSVLLACTELGLALTAADVSLPVYDTAALHIAAAASFALGEAPGRT